MATERIRIDWVMKANFFELKPALERIGMGLAKERRVSGLDYYTMVLVLKRIMESGYRPSEPDQGSGVEIVIGKLAQGG